MIIDCHAHAGNYEEIIAGKQPEMLEEVIALMDVAGVDQTYVLPAPTGRDQPVSREHNRLLIENVTRYEGLLPFCCVDVGDPAETRDQLAEALDLGARGWKLHPILQRVPTTSSELYLAYELAEQRKIPVLVHSGQFMGHRTAGKARPGPLGLANPIGLDEVAEDFPDLKIIMAHFGWPWLQEALAIMQRRDNVYLDLSGWAPKHFPAELRPHLLRASPDKFVFGTDFPAVTPERWLREFREMSPSDEVFEMVTHGNIARIMAQ